ncbi:MAG: lipopolysaccharide heptosyltransferase family protein [Neisseriaceae bacterium]|nr:MAG: lipopolysaccharide heptosyltransferase family protein [Neisseriaceae bacterium]
MKIAIIRTDLIGDFLLWLESAKIVRNEYPDAHITLICNNIYVELAQEITCFDQIITLDIQKLRKLNLIYLLKTYTKLRQKTYDLLINPMITRNSIVDLLSLFINANVKVASNADYNKYKILKPLFDKFYAKLIAISITGFHELELNNLFCNQLLNRNSNIKLPNLLDLLKIPPLKFSLEDFKQYIAVNLSTSTSSRNWPLKNFETLLANIPKDIAIIIIGSKNEQPLANQIIQRLANYNQIIDKTGKTTLIESLNIINSAKIFIGNESALVHMATLLNINTISFLGGGYAHRFLPYPSSLIAKASAQHKVLYQQLPCFNCNWHCQYPLENNITWRCIANISLDDAITALSGSLNNEM